MVRRNFNGARGGNGVPPESAQPVVIRKPSIASIDLAEIGAPIRRGAVGACLPHRLVVEHEDAYRYLVTERCAGFPWLLEMRTRSSTPVRNRRAIAGNH